MKSSMMIVLSSIACAVAPFADAAANASGQVGDWTVVDAIAVRDDDGGVRIVVSDKPFDRAGIAADLRFDIRDTSEHEDIAQGRMLSLYLDAEGKLSSLGFGGSSSYSSGMDEALVLRTRTKDAIAGQFEHDAIKIDFELPLWANGAIPRIGASLAADGGEGGKALQAYLAAVAADDIDSFIALSPPTWRESMNRSKASGEGQQEIDAVSSELPQAIQIVGGHGEAQRAWIDLSATRDGKPVKAVATVERDAGGWYVRRIETLQ